jgi:hypothetical protein
MSARGGIVQMREFVANDPPLRLHRGEWHVVLPDDPELAPLRRTAAWVRIPGTRGLSRIRDQDVHVCLVPADQWQAFLRLPAGVRIDTAHALRILERAERWQEAEHLAACVEAAIARTVAHFYRTRGRFAPYEARAARAWAVVEDELARVAGAETPLFARAEARAWSRAGDDLLVATEAELRAFARRQFRRV